MKKYFLIILLIAAAACSSSDETTKVEIPSDLEDNSVISDSKSFSVNIPENWKNVTDNVETLFDIWLLSSDDKAVIGFIPVNVNKNIDEVDKIKLLAKFELEALKSKEAEIDNNETFSLINIDGILASPLTYQINGKNYNLIIFGKNNIYYKSIAYFSNSYKPTEDEMKDLIELQKLVISSAKFN